MGVRYVKCQFCNESIPYSERETLAHEEKEYQSKGVTKTKNIYWHQECYPKELKQREFLLQEKKEKDELNETLQKIYKVKYNFSSNFWWMISDLREGTNRFQKFWKKKYKQGIPFPVIREAYMMSVQDIEWARMSKSFKNLNDEMRYGLMIMQGKVNDAYRKMKTREQQSKINEAREEIQIEDMKENRQVSFKKKQQDRDYSYLLGND